MVYKEFEKFYDLGRKHIRNAESNENLRKNYLKITEGHKIHLEHLYTEARDMNIDESYLEEMASKINDLSYDIGRLS